MLREDQTEVEIMETVDYGDTDYRYEMEGDRKYDDDYDKGSLARWAISHRSLTTTANW